MCSPFVDELMIVFVSLYAGFADILKKALIERERAVDPPEGAILLKT